MRGETSGTEASEPRETSGEVGSGRESWVTRLAGSP